MLFIPEQTKKIIDAYVLNKKVPSSFVLSILCNDLNQTCARSDEANRNYIFNIVIYVYNNVPEEAWGSPEKVNN